MTESAYGNYHRKHNPWKKGDDRFLSAQEDLEWQRSSRFDGMQGLHAAQNSQICIAGVGAVGHNLAMALGTMGFRNLILIDPDIVEASNLGTQGYSHPQMGQRKIDACKENVLARYPDCQVKTLHGKIGDKTRIGEKDYVAPPEGGYDVLFTCVDDMATRNEILADKKLHPGRLVVDTRMGAFGARVISDTPPFTTKWKPSLFADSAAFAGTCTLQSTFFAASVCSGFAVASMSTFFAAQHGGAPFESLDFIVDLLDMDITHQEGKEPTKKQQLDGNVAILKLNTEVDHAVLHTAQQAVINRGK